jgi:hypothetical protein
MRSVINTRDIDNHVPGDADCEVAASHLRLPER